MKRNSNKYRVSVYLGKSMYNDMAQLSQMLGIPLPTLIKTLLSVGKNFSDMIASQGDFKL